MSSIDRLMISIDAQSGPNSLSIEAPNGPWVHLDTPDLRNLSGVGVRGFSGERLVGLGYGRPAAVLNDRRIEIPVVVGAVDSFYRPTLLTPPHGCAAPPIVRVGFTATRLSERPLVAIAGGIDDRPDGIVLSRGVYGYDGSFGGFRALGEIPAGAARAFHTAHPMGANTVVLLGGVGARPGGQESLGSAAFLGIGFEGGLRVSGSTLLERRSGHVSEVLSDGRILMAGGRRSVLPEGSDFAYSSSIELFDPRTGEATATSARLSAPRHDATSVLVAGDLVAILGGFNSQGTVATVDVIQVSGDEVEVLTSSTSLGTGAVGLAAAALDDGWIIVSGGAHDSACLESQEPCAVSAMVELWRVDRALTRSKPAGEGCTLPERFRRPTRALLRSAHASKLAARRGHERPVVTSVRWPPHRGVDLGAHRRLRLERADRIGTRRSGRVHGLAGRCRRRLP